MQAVSQLTEPLNLERRRDASLDMSIETLPCSVEIQAQRNESHAQCADPALLPEAGMFARRDRGAIEQAEQRFGHLGHRRSPFIEQAGDQSDGDENRTHHDSGHELLNSDHRNDLTFART